MATNADDEAAFTEQLTGMASDDEPLETVLKTDRRVIARVTDGIYRQPGSALRELISNAYDADATRVVIRTDRPRFARFEIEDDGVGMSPRTLVHLLNHIGGSAKRTSLGAELGLADLRDPRYSKGGRRMIGKIGIGLFSVAQLTQAFQIITKVEHDDFRTVASIVLRQFSEDDAIATDDESEYEAGKVLVWREPAEDLSSHGTTVVLTAVRPQTRETLQSVERWESVYVNDDTDEETTVRPPRFHVGVVSPRDETSLRGTAKSRSSLPWRPSDRPDEAFEEMVLSVWRSQNGVGAEPNPRLTHLFDYYLRMVWGLSLAIPAPYLAVHPFDLTNSSDVMFYDLGELTAEPASLEQGETVREHFGLGSVVEDISGFRVFFDELLLKRPIDVRDKSFTTGALKVPMVFYGQHEEDFGPLDRNLSGGPVSFQAYIVWAPKIVPTEHQGVLIRVHEASGTVFDPTFLNFPVSEQRRLAQMSCEVFVTQGFDGALNIDRESFNFAHPHVVALTRWLHKSLRQVINAQKRLGSAARATRRSETAETMTGRAAEVVSAAWQRISEDDGSEPPAVVITDEPPENAAAYVLGRRILGPPAVSATQRARAQQVEVQLRSIAQILAAYDLFDALTQEQREQLLSEVREILEATK